MKILPLAALVLLAGCTAAPEIAAVVAGGAAGLATASPAVGFAVGVAVDAGANYAFRSIARTRQGAEQDAIAQVAGNLPIGTGADWKIEHSIPIGNEHGTLRVVRVIDSPLACCKEVAFSVDDGKGDSLKRAWFTTAICKQAERWKWAAAEPAVERWGVSAITLAGISPAGLLVPAPDGATLRGSLEPAILYPDSAGTRKSPLRISSGAILVLA